MSNNPFAPNYQEKNIHHEINKEAEDIDLKFGEQEETAEGRLQNRLKQIRYGKNTIGYDNYIKAVPKDKRRRIPQHPTTPDPKEKISKRAFDGKIRVWRRLLHQWDEGRPDLDFTTEEILKKKKNDIIEYNQAKKRKREEEENIKSAKRKLTGQHYNPNSNLNKEDTSSSSSSSSIPNISSDLLPNKENEETLNNNNNNNNIINNEIDCGEQIDDGYVSEDVL